MSLISAKCKSCGANLRFDNTQKTIICPYCDTQYIMDNAEGNIPAEPASFIIQAGVLIKYTGSAAEVVIPDSVTVIGKKAFRFSNITKLTIPGTVKKIEAKAFSFCSNLTEIAIAPGVMSIGAYAFYNCKRLKKIAIPGSIKTIETYTFGHCSDLAEVTIGPGVTNIKSFAFCSCTNLTAVSFPSNSIRIDASAFGWCENLRQIYIPDTVVLAKKYSTPFLHCDNLQINASDEWKRENYLCHKSLKAYRPKA